MQRTNPSRLQTGLRRLRLDWVLYALLLPTLVYFVIFRVIPIWNMRLAFYNFSGRSAWTWAGLKYFEMMFGSPLMKDHSTQHAHHQPDEVCAAVSLLSAVCHSAVGNAFGPPAQIYAGRQLPAALSLLGG